MLGYKGSATGKATTDRPGNAECPPKTMTDFVSSLGLDVLGVGDLAAMRLLERPGMLNIHRSQGFDLGTKIAPTYQRGA